MTGRDTFPRPVDFLPEGNNFCVSDKTLVSRTSFLNVEYGGNEIDLIPET